MPPIPADNGNTISLSEQRHMLVINQKNNKDFVLALPCVSVSLLQGKHNNIVYCRAVVQREEHFRQTHLTLYATLCVMHFGEPSEGQLKGKRHSL
jgi:hypothetical protein